MTTGASAERATMAHLLLAAALTSAASRPLFTPPAGMTRSSADTRTAREVAKEGGSVVETFHGVAHFKPSWSKFTYDEPFTVTIARYPDTESVNADEWGLTSLVRVAAPRDIPANVKTWCAAHPHCTPSSIHMPKFEPIANHRISVCDWQSGWLNSYTFAGSGENYQQAFVRSGNVMYVALFRYSKATGDPLHATDSLSTLCPPNAGEARSLTTAVPFQPPKNWKRSAGDGGPLYQHTQIGSWFHVSSSGLGEWVTLMQESDVSEYTTPEQVAAAWNAEAKATLHGFHVQSNRAVQLCSDADAWLSIFTTTDSLGERLIVESMYAATTICTSCNTCATPQMVKILRRAKPCTRSVRHHSRPRQLRQRLLSHSFAAGCYEGRPGLLS